MMNLSSENKDFFITFTSLTYVRKHTREIPILQVLAIRPGISPGGD